MKYLTIVALLLIAGSPSASAQHQDFGGVRDQHGFEFSLTTWAEDRLVVVAFLGAECPLAKVYANRLNDLYQKYHNNSVCFVAINSNHGDTYEQMVEFAKALDFLIVKDEGNAIADQFGATRSPEVFLLDNNREIIYQGRIDDQYEPGVHSRTEPARHDLEEAIQEALDNEAISVPATVPSGCHIDRRIRSAPANAESAVTYSQHVAGIIDRKCVECHRPGQSAPFSLLSYDDAAGWTDTIREVLTEGRMPPWGADPRYGCFANDRSLSEEERRLLFAWLDGGAPQGDPALRPAPPKFASEWTIQPDLVLTAPQFTVPEQGLLDYQEFVIDPGLTQDTWIDAVEVKPSNRAVVHHATVYLQPKDAKPGMMYSRAIRDNYLSMYVPGNSAMVLPKGFAKCIPAGWNFRISIHYVPNGEKQQDQTSIGLRLAQGNPSYEVATRLFTPGPFELQPGEVRTLVAEEALSEDMVLVALYPHMHLRGRSMLFEAIYPDQKQEVLLNVPDYDFEWQHRYELASLKPLPKGTLIRCTAVFDNSRANKRNPDPTAMVKEGEKTEDEMFLGVFELARPAPTRKPGFAIVAVGLAIGGLFLLTKLKDRPVQRVVLVVAVTMGCVASLGLG
jgi:mono/diheme cytochrome c family protein